MGDKGPKYQSLHRKARYLILKVFNYVKHTMVDKSMVLPSYKKSHKLLEMGEGGKEGTTLFVSCTYVCLSAQ
jgi:hypothetical protein